MVVVVVIVVGFGKGKCYGCRCGYSYSYSYGFCLRRAYLCSSLCLHVCRRRLCLVCLCLSLLSSSVSLFPLSCLVFADRKKRSKATTKEDE